MLIQLCVCVHELITALECWVFDILLWQWEAPTIHLNNSMSKTNHANAYSRALWFSINTVWAYVFPATTSSTGDSNHIRLSRFLCYLQLGNISRKLLKTAKRSHYLRILVTQWTKLGGKKVQQRATAQLQPITIANNVISHEIKAISLLHIASNKRQTGYGSCTCFLRERASQISKYMVLNVYWFS